MIEKYRYRGRAANGEWIYFMAYSDEDAKVEFRNMTGLTGLDAVVQTYDEDFKFWMDCSSTVMV